MAPSKRKQLKAKKVQQFDTSNVRLEKYKSDPRTLSCLRNCEMELYTTPCLSIAFREYGLVDRREHEVLTESTLLQFIFMKMIVLLSSSALNLIIKILNPLFCLVELTL